jgi:hypothetical protein
VKTLLVSIVTTFGLILAGAAHAAAPASAPAGTTAQCKDGSWYSGAGKKGACHGHQGIKEWYGTGDMSPTTPKSTSTKADSTSSPSTTAATPKASKSATANASSTATAVTSPRPADATGLCNDGTYYTGDSKRGACHGHKGVKDWYGAGTAAAPKTASASPSATPAGATMPAAAFPKPNPSTMPNAQTPTSGTMSSTSHSTMPGGTSAAPGGGAGKVWVNSGTKVYHCSGDRYYGKTKEGEYMSEADAIAKGNRAAHGKACSS